MARLIIFASMLTAMLAVSVDVLRAQTLILDAPAGPTLPNVTPKFTLRALGLPVSARPLRYTLFITKNSTGDSPFERTIVKTELDSVVSFFVPLIYPVATTVFWKARVQLPDGRVVESAISSARLVPKALTLVFPNSPTGDPVTRRPQFKWVSAGIDPEFSDWTYDIQVLNKGLTEISASGLKATEFIPNSELQANAPYHWQVRASLTVTGESISERNIAEFFVADPALPTITLLYQNFPNPFPSAVAFSTCFWFDVGVGGAKISLDILDLRGTLVKRIIASEDFSPGTYGRGTIGSENNCDNRYVWNGTANDGRTVAGGVYLARFIASGAKPSIKRIVFLGR